MKAKDIEKIQGNIGLAPASIDQKAFCLYFGYDNLLDKYATLTWLSNHYGRPDWDAFWKIREFIPENAALRTQEKITLHWSLKATKWLNEVIEEGYLVDLEGYKFTFLPDKL